MALAGHFPNESKDYRAARKKLLQAELELRRKVEAVAAQRRKLPPGGEILEDYVFEGPDGKVKLSQLFRNGNTQHIAQRTNLVVIAKSPLARILDHARTRGWSNLKLLSSEKNDYNRDYHGESADGSQNPILNVFVKDGKKIRHWYATELVFAKPDAGQDPRHIDMMWPLWNLLDFTPEGRGKD